MRYFTSKNPGEREAMIFIAAAARKLRERENEQLAVRIVNTLGQSISVGGR